MTKEKGRIAPALMRFNQLAVHNFSVSSGTAL